MFVIFLDFVWLGAESPARVAQSPDVSAARYTILRGDYDGPCGDWWVLRGFCGGSRPARGL